MRLVEEEHELRLVEVSHFGQQLVELGEQIHEERREQRGLVGDAGHLEQRDHAAPVGGGAQKIVHVELGFAEEHIGPVVGEGDELAQNDPGRRGREPAELFQLAFALVAREVAEHGAQVREIDQREPVLVGVVEHQPEARLLRRVEAEHLAQQQRPEPRHRRAHGHALADAPEGEVFGDGCLGLPLLADRLGAGEELVVRLPRRRNARQVALHVGGEDRHALRGELLGEPLQRAGLSGAGGARDEPVPVHHAEGNADLRRRHRVAVHERAEVERLAREGVPLRDRRDLVGVERAGHLGARHLGGGHRGRGIRVSRLRGRGARGGERRLRLSELQSGLGRLCFGLQSGQFRVVGSSHGAQPSDRSARVHG